MSFVTNPESNNQCSLHSVTMIDIIHVRGIERSSHRVSEQNTRKTTTHVSWALLVLHVVARYGLDICQARELFGLDESAHLWRCRYARGYLSIRSFGFEVESACLTE